MIEPVGSVAPIMLAQSLAGDQMTQIGLRMAGVFGGELGRLRAETAFGTGTGAVPAALAAAPPADVRAAEALSALGHRYASLGAHAVADGARPRVARRDGRREGDGRDGGRGDADERDAGGGGGEPDGAAGAARAVAVEEGRVRALEAGLRDCADLLHEAGWSGTPITCLLPAHPTLAQLPAAAHDCDLFVLCLAFDGSLGESRHVWGFGFADDRTVLSLGGTRVEGEADVAAGDGAWRLAFPDAARGPRADIVCESAGGVARGLRLAPEPPAQEPGGWSVRPGEIAWH